MSESHSITLRRGKELLEAVLVQQEPEDHQALYGLELTYPDKTIAANGEDYFEALLALRRVLEEDGILMNIYGASKNVWPSGMSRSMGDALLAYRMTMGKQALTKDLVHIFASGPDVQPTTVAEQEEYRDAWFASLGRQT